jgi:hypothetical protein
MTAIPLSLPQRRIWFLQHLYDDDVMYNTNRCFRIQGPIDMEALRVTLQTLALRHEPLRTRFQIDQDGSPFQVVEKEPRIDIEETDLSDMQECNGDIRSGLIVREAVLRPFNLFVGPMLRVVLVRLHKRDAILLFVQHHIITDDRAWRIFLSEFMSVYTAIIMKHQFSLSPLTCHYSDFVKVQALLLTEDNVTRRLKYWRELFSGYMQLDLRSDEISESLINTPPPSYASLRQSISSDRVRDCKALAQSQNCTLFIVVLTAIALLVRFLYCNNQVLLCLASANRQSPGAEKVIGCFFTNIIVSLNIRSDQKLAELLQDVKATFSTARRYQDMPFEMFAEDLGLVCTRQRKPPYRVYISYRQSADDEEFSLPDTRITKIEAKTGRNTHEDIVFNFWEKKSNGGMCLDLEWLCRTDLFSREAIKGMSTMLEVLFYRLPRDMSADVQSLLDDLAARPLS